MISSCSFLLALQLRSKTALVLFTSMSSFPAHPTLRLGGSLLPPLCLVVASRAATQVRSSPNARASQFRSTVGQEPKSSLSISLFHCSCLSLCFLSIYLFSSYPFFVSNNNDCTMAADGDSIQKGGTNTAIPKRGWLRTSRAQNLFALLLSALIHKKSLSVGYLRGLSRFSRQNKLMKMLVDPVFSRGFLMQMVVTTISYNVYKCMLQKNNFSDIVSLLFE